MHQNFQNVFKRTTTDDATGSIYCIAFSIPIQNLIQVDIIHIRVQGKGKMD